MGRTSSVWTYVCERANESAAFFGRPEFTFTFPSLQARLPLSQQPAPERRLLWGRKGDPADTQERVSFPGTHDRNS
jgi:hypothetical protein